MVSISYEDITKAFPNLPVYDEDNTTKTEALHNKFKPGIDKSCRRIKRRLLGAPLYDQLGEGDLLQLVKELICVEAAIYCKEVLMLDITNSGLVVTHGKELVAASDKKVLEFFSSLEKRYYLLEDEVIELLEEDDTNKWAEGDSDAYQEQSRVIKNARMFSHYINDVTRREYKAVFPYFSLSEMEIKRTFGPTGYTHIALNYADKLEEYSANYAAAHLPITSSMYHSVTTIDKERNKKYKEQAEKVMFELKGALMEDEDCPYEVQKKLEVVEVVNEPGEGVYIM